MNSRTSWLFVLAVCVASSKAGAGAEIRVVQPGTNKLIAYAEVSIVTTGTPSVCIYKGSTGLSGQPFDTAAAEEGRRDPQYDQLMLEVKKHDISGRMQITYDRQKHFWQQVYDPDEGAWKPAHARGDWRPRLVYEYDEEKEQWKSTEYAQWKAGVVADEEERIKGPLGLKPGFMNVVMDELTDALKKGPVGNVPQAADDATLDELIGAARKTRIHAVFSELMDTDLKAPIDPALMARVEDALLTVPDRDSGDYIKVELNSLIAAVREDAPEPPVIRVLIERPYSIPVRTYGQWLHATERLVVPAYGMPPQTCRPCLGP